MQENNKTVILESKLETVINKVYTEEDMVKAINN